MSESNLRPPPTQSRSWFLFCGALSGLYDLVEAQPSLFYLSGLLYRLVDHRACALINKSVRSTQGPTRPHFIYALRPTEQMDRHGRGNKEEWKMRHGHEMTEKEERLNGQREVKSESKRSPARLAEAQALGEKKKKDPIQQASSRCSLQMCLPPG